MVNQSMHLSIDSEPRKLLPSDNSGIAGHLLEVVENRLSQNGFSTDVHQWILSGPIGSCPTSTPKALVDNEPRVGLRTACDCGWSVPGARWRRRGDYRDAMPDANCQPLAMEAMSSIRNYWSSREPIQGSRRPTLYPVRTPAGRPSRPGTPAGWTEGEDAPCRLIEPHTRWVADAPGTVCLREAPEPPGYPTSVRG